MGECDKDEEMTSTELKCGVAAASYHATHRNVNYTVRSNDRGKSRVRIRSIIIEKYGIRWPQLNLSQDSAINGTLKGIDNETAYLAAHHVFYDRSGDSTTNEKCEKKYILCMG